MCYEYLSRGLARATSRYAGRFLPIRVNKISRRPKRPVVMEYLANPMVNMLASFFYHVFAF